MNHNYQKTLHLHHHHLFLQNKNKRNQIPSTQQNLKFQKLCNSIMKIRDFHVVIQVVYVAPALTTTNILIIRQ